MEFSKTKCWARIQIFPRASIRLRTDETAFIFCKTHRVSKNEHPRNVTQLRQLRTLIAENEVSLFEMPGVIAHARTFRKEDSMESEVSPAASNFPVNRLLKIKD